MRFSVSAVALVAVAAAVLGWGRRGAVSEARQAYWAETQARSGQEVRLLMELPSRIRESSGVLVSSVNPGVFWTHNDSGGEPVLYGVRPDDGSIVELRLNRAPASDWEDLDDGPCPHAPLEPCLFVGDIGDNLGRRESVTVLVVAEPRLPAVAPPYLSGEWRAATLKYPSGPRDAEALVVSEAGVVRIVTKGREGEHGVYRAPADFLRRQGSEPVDLLPDGRLPLVPVLWLGRVVTAGADWAGGIAVRTYTEVYLFGQGPGGWEATAVPCVVAPLGPAGEGLDIGPDGTVYLSREATRVAPAALEAVDCGFSPGP